MNQQKPKIICVVGATGSGKTGLGVKLAKKFNGEIISADSRQIYKHLNIATGKDIAEYGNIKYHLIDICQPGERFTLFDWLERAKIIITDIIKRGKLPIVVGGTGLYVSALVEGYSINKKSNIKYKKYHRYSRRELEGKTLKELQQIYGELLTANYELDLNNPHRLIRAIEKQQSGEVAEKTKPEFESLVLAIDLDRKELYQRIDKRADERFEAGMLEEILNLLEDSKNKKSNIKNKKDQNKGNNSEMAKWLISLGLDIRMMTEYLLENDLDGNQSYSIPPVCHSELDSESIKTGSRIPTSPRLRGAGKCGMTQKKEENRDQNYLKMVERFKFAEHAYARRQLTWWRQKKGVVWVKNFEEAITTVKPFFKSK